MSSGRGAAAGANFSEFSYKPGDKKKRRTAAVSPSRGEGCDYRCAYATRGSSHAMVWV